MARHEDQVIYLRNGTIMVTGTVPVLNRDPQLGTKKMVHTIKDPKNPDGPRLIVIRAKGISNHWMEEGFSSPPIDGDTLYIDEESRYEIHDVFYLSSAVRPGTFLVDTTVGLVWIQRLPGTPFWKVAPDMTG